MNNPKQALADEQIIKAAIEAKLHDEMWFGPHTPDGYEDTLPKLHRFAAAIVAQMHSEAVQLIGYIDSSAITHLLNGHDAHISKDPVADDDIAVYATSTENEPRFTEEQVRERINAALEECAELAQDMDYGDGEIARAIRAKKT